MAWIIQSLGEHFKVCTPNFHKAEKIEEVEWFGKQNQGSGKTIVKGRPKIRHSIRKEGES